MNIHSYNNLINANEYELYNIVKKNYNFNKNICKISKIDLNYFNNFKNLLKKDNYFDWNFCIHFSNNCKYSYYINYKNINFYILMNIPITEKIKNHLNLCIYRVYLVKLLYKIKPGQNINYFILLSPIKRKLPNKNKDINAENINGGFTYINSNNIYIIRKEDYEKVVIHELLHHCNDIHYDDWKNHNINILKKLCNIADDQVFIPNEAIIETFAIILNVIFVSIENNLSFKNLLEADKKHNIIIAKKIINKQNNSLWREKSHSYCYIVLRAVFYIYFKHFVKNFIVNNDDNITKFICKYFPKIIKKITKISIIEKNKFIKQTIFNNF